MKSIEEDFRNENPCLFFLAWRLRSSSLVLVVPTLPALSNSVPTPEFIVAYASQVVKKCPSEYLQNGAWISDLKATMKVVVFGAVDETMVEKAKCLLLSLQQRLYIHISDRVDERRRHHWTLNFIWENLASVASAKFLVGHIADHLEFCGVHECLMMIPKEDAYDYVFQSILNQPEGLGTLEVCYLNYDTKKKKWIQSGNASGVGNNARFNDFRGTHENNARSLDQMRQHHFYQKYPVEGVDNIGGIGGCFEYLEVYFGMAFDKKEDVSPR